MSPPPPTTESINAATNPKQSKSLIQMGLNKIHISSLPFSHYRNSNYQFAKCKELL